MFEDIRHERSLILLLSLTDLDILKQRNLTDHEIIEIKNSAQIKKVYTQRALKEYVAVHLLE